MATRVGVPNLFLENFETALKVYLERRDKAALRSAYELGSKAMEQGIDAAALVAVHRKLLTDNLVKALPPAVGRAFAGDVEALCVTCRSFNSSTQSSEWLTAVEPFLAASLEPFRKSERSLRKANEALRRVNEIRESEAKRVAQALHREAGQLLTSIHIELAAVNKNLGPSESERVNNARAMLDEVEEQLRGLSHELCPPVLHDLGLAPALEFLAQGVSRRHGISISVTGALEKRLPICAEITLYRVAQEALNNAVRHAHAGKVSITLKQSPRTACCSIADDGVGFDLAVVLRGSRQHGLGLAAMRERMAGAGGSLGIFSQPGRGTEIRARIKLPKS